MGTVLFRNIRRSLDGLIQIDANMDGRESELRFHLGVPHVPADDLVALALGMLCGQKFDRVVIEGLKAPAKCREAIEMITKAEVELDEGDPEVREQGTKSVLSFSGGFDSLSAMLMMPPEHSLYSNDFGGKFARERLFFEKFNPIIVETNLVDEGYNKLHSEFMYAGAVLLHDYLQTDYLSFGDIMGLTAREMVMADSPQEEKPTLAQTYLGITPYKPVRGLTEAGTAGLTQRYFPDQVAASLASLANPREGKYTRKLLTLRAYQISQGLKVDTLPLPDAGPWFFWGKGFTEDFISVFLIKHLGLETVQAIYRDPIPAAVVEAAMDLPLDYYLKVFPTGERGRNDEFGHLVDAVTDSTLLGPVSAADISEAREVVTLLESLMNVAEAPVNSEKQPARGRSMWQRVIGRF